jgi:hypothetical protein
MRRRGSSAWLLAGPRTLRQSWKMGAMPRGRKTICPPDEGYSLSTARSALVPRLIWMGLPEPSSHGYLGDCVGVYSLVPGGLPIARSKACSSPFPAHPRAPGWRQKNRISLWLGGSETSVKHRFRVSSSGCRSPIRLRRPPGFRGGVAASGVRGSSSGCKWLRGHGEGGRRPTNTVTPPRSVGVRSYLEDCWSSVSRSVRAPAVAA